MGAAAYNFGYNVVNDQPQAFNHEENRAGDETHGEYRVALPDGRTQIVTYQVTGDSGFIADVRYEGEAIPYKYVPAAAPVYAPLPKPVYHAAPAPAVAYNPAAPVYKPAPVLLPAPVPAPA